MVPADLIRLTIAVMCLVRATSSVVSVALTSHVSRSGPPKVVWKVSNNQIPAFTLVCLQSDTDCIRLRKQIKHEGPPE